jgi:hypothetical protein
VTAAEADTVGVNVSVVAAACSVLDSLAVMTGVTDKVAVARRVTVAEVDSDGVTDRVAAATFVLVCDAVIVGVTDKLADAL